MYPDQRLEQSPLQHAAGMSNAPQQPGMSTVVKSLMSAAQENIALAQNLSSSLGIQSPKASSTGEAAAASMTDAIAFAIRMINQSSREMEDCLRHINT